MDNNLNTVISVIKVKTCEIIGVVTKNNEGNFYNISYPTKKKRPDVWCGGSSANTCDVKSIRPATDEEIKVWRNAEGVAKSARAKANTADKVKEIKWVAASLRIGEKIITTI